MQSFHTAIIGAGSAGITVAVGLAGLGKKVALIERAHVGGDCTNVGCVPSKTLIHLANHVPNLSPAEVLKKVRERRDHLRDEETEWLANSKNISLFKADARFLSTTTLELTQPSGQEILSANNIVIATGSRPKPLSISGLPEDMLVTNESLFDLETLPKHMVIVGAGIIGIEMAFAFRKLGSEVSLIGKAPRVLNALEPEVSEAIEKRLEALGVNLYLNDQAVHFDDSTLVLQSKHRLTQVDKVLVAVGRIPNLNLGLENAGVNYTTQGIPSNSYGKTNVSNIYAIGDVNFNSAFTHSANAQGRRLVQKIAFPFLPVGKEPVYPSATFSEPEVAQVGPTLESLKKRFKANLIKTYRYDLNKTDRGYTSFLEDGFVLIHAMAVTGRVLSATIVAPSAGEMIPILTQAVNGGASMYKLANLVFPYPTLSEAIKKAASNYVFESLPKLPKDIKTYIFQRWQKP